MHVRFVLDENVVNIDYPKFVGIELFVGVHRIFCEDCWFDFNKLLNFVSIFFMVIEDFSISISE